jgi:hypothetical protein
MKRQEAVLLKDLLQMYVRKMGMDSGLNISRIYNAWEIVIGENYASYTVSRSYRNKRLYCRINSSVVKHKIFMEKASIKRKMNELLGSELVDEIILL